MGKPLSEMSLEELWQLFPIILTEHQECWEEWFREEEALLAQVLPLEACIQHIGSTAIKTIWAKPIVDILVEVPKERAFAEIEHLLQGAGYRCMSRSEMCMSFNKGYTEAGFAQKVFHLHLRHDGDHDEVAFRDYLNAHPEAAREYEQLKLALWKQYEHDRDGYTDAKAEIVRKYTDAAKADCTDRA